MSAIEKFMTKFRDIVSTSQS